MFDAYKMLVSRIELATANSFLRKIYFYADDHLSSDVQPHDVNELLEFLIKMLFVYG